MKGQEARIVDGSHRVIATARVELQGEWYEGAIDLTRMPSDLRALFEEYEEIVNGQMFSFLDEIEGRVEALGLKVAFVEGDELSPERLLIYPRDNHIAFRVCQPSLA